MSEASHEAYMTTQRGLQNYKIKSREMPLTRYLMLNGILQYNNMQWRNIMQWIFHHRKPITYVFKIRFFYTMQHIYASLGTYRKSDGRWKINKMIALKTTNLISNSSWNDIHCTRTRSSLHTFSGKPQILQFKSIPALSHHIRDWWPYVWFLKEHIQNPLSLGILEIDICNH